MAFNWDQRSRLLREDWDAPSLSQELYAMFSPDAPSNTQGPIQIALPPGSTEAPITIGNANPNTPTTIFNITHQDGSSGGTINFNAGNLTFTSPAPGAQPVPMTGGGGGGNVIPVWG